MARAGVRITRIGSIATLLCLGASAVNGGVDGGNPSSPMYIQYQLGRLRVSLHRAPWDQVLHEIERRTGVTIEVKGELSGTTTQAFDDLPLEQGLRWLFKAAHVVVFYEGGGQTRVSHVWLIPKTASTPPTGAPASVVAAVDAAYEPDDRLTALQTFATQGDLEGLQEALFDPDQTIQALALDLLRGWGSQSIIDALLRATTSEEPATRVRALTLLQEANFGQEGVVLAALAVALTDPDTIVKTHALHALTARGGAEAVGALGQALQDPDTSIRRMAIESIAANPEGRALLREALSHDDDTIRALAAFWLEQTPAKEP
jgi:hypothetical protein